MNNNCIFCKIIGDEIPSNKIYEDDLYVAFLDISPANKGHIVVMPKKHIENLFQLEDAYANNLMLVVKKIATSLKKELNCDGINLLQNNGEAAGQTVHHYHMHIIPRYKDDSVHITWESKAYEGQEGRELAEAIRGHMI